MLSDLFKEYNENITHEMIHTQTDRGFIPLVVKELDVIKNIIINNDIRSSNTLIDNNDFKKVVSKVNNLLSERFKYNINIIDRVGIGLATVPVYPPNFNVLNGSSSRFIESLSDYFSQDKLKDKKYLDPKEILNFDKNVDDVYNNIYKSYKALREQLNKSHVVIDNKNATISNLPKDYNVFIYIDFTFVMHDKGLNLTSEELLAAILHEVGHTYTAFEKSVYSVYSTVVLLDTIQESINNKNNDPINVLKISYDKMTGTNGTLKNKDTIEVISTLRDNLEGYNYNDDKFYQNSRISSEQQADQFVSRFGLGKELIIGLEKLGTSYRMFNSMESGGATSFITLSLLALIFNPGVGFIMVFFTIICLITGTEELKEYNKYDKIYDSGVRRYLRVKQDAIRQMRLLDKNKYDKELFKRLEDAVLTVDAKLKILTNEKSKTFLNKFYDRYQYDAKTKKVVNMLELVEELMENDLHYLSLKIKELKK